MIVKRRNFWLFIVASVACLLVLMAMPGPNQFIDSRTGRRVVQADDYLKHVRESGDARRGYDTLGWLLHEANADERLGRIHGVLWRELTSIPVRPPSEKQLELLEHPGTDPHLVVDLLEELTGDSPVAAATEQFFGEATDAIGLPDRPLLTFNSRRPGPDLRAINLQRRRSAIQARVQQVRQGSEVEVAGEPSAAAYVGLADSFALRGRGRAQLRWLLRGFRAWPDDADLVDRLTGYYLASGQLPEAMAVSTITARRFAHGGLARRAGAKEAGADGSIEPQLPASYWRRHAELARWSDAATDELTALKQILIIEGDLDARKRIVDLYVYLGQPERAVEHAEHVALMDGTEASMSFAADLALRGGNVDEALEFFDRLAESTGDHAKWLSHKAEVASQDLRIDVACDAYEQLLAIEPSESVIEALELLYRRSDQARRLANLYAWRVARDPENQLARYQGVSQYSALKEEGSAQWLAMGAGRDETVPPAFVPYSKRREVLEEARALVAHPEPDAAEVDRVLQGLRGMLDAAAARDAADELLERAGDRLLASKLGQELAWRTGSPEARALSMERLVARFPDSPNLVTHWMGCLAGVEDVPTRIRAYVANLDFDPGDDVGREELAVLYQLAGEWDNATVHWLKLASRPGFRPRIVTNLVEALFQAGRDSEAGEWLDKLASSPDATLEDRLRAAESFFGHERFDRARGFYLAALREDPDEELALLRLGQIDSWSNAPNAAIPWLERRLEITDDQRVEVEFLLGECYWSVDRGDDARAVHATALARLLEANDETGETLSMVAKLNARLGNSEAAKVGYRELILRDPDNVSVALDYVELLLADRELGAADDMLLTLADLRTGNVRILRTEARLRMMQELPASAVSSLEEAVVAAEDADSNAAEIHADLARAREAAEDPFGAIDAYRRWGELKPDLVDPRREVQRIADDVLHRVIAEVETREAGSDSSFVWALGASIRVWKAARLVARVASGSYEGSAGAAAENFGTGLVDTKVTTLDLGMTHEGRGPGAFGGGLIFAAGSGVDSRPGLWTAGTYRLADSPFVAIEGQAVLEEPWLDPAGAAAFDGRRTGLEVSAYGESSDGVWLSGRAGWHRLGLDAPDSGRARDSQVLGEASVGWRWTDGVPAVADRPRYRRAPTGPRGPFLDAEPEDTPGPYCNSWVTLQTVTLHDDARLVDLLPMAQRTENILLSTRVDWHIARDLGVGVEAFIGRELSTSTAVWGMEGRATWRVNQTYEWSAGLGFGETSGRGAGQNGSSFHGRVQGVVRF